MSELVPCKFCGHKPSAYKVSLLIKGVGTGVWCVECAADEDEDEEIFPYAEHRITVYGIDKCEAEERWNFINSFVPEQK